MHRRVVCESLSSGAARFPVQLPACTLRRRLHAAVAFHAAPRQGPTAEGLLHNRQMREPLQISTSASMVRSESQHFAPRAA